MLRLTLLLCAAVGILVLCFGGGDSPAEADEQVSEKQAGKPPPELGSVRWLRDHDKAFALAGKQKRPVFLFFQEVPG